MISFQLRFRYQQIKYFFTHHIPWFIAWAIPRKIALYCFVRVYSVLGEFGTDYERAYTLFDSGKGQ